MTTTSTGMNNAKDANALLIGKHFIKISLFCFACATTLLQLSEYTTVTSSQEQIVSRGLATSPAEPLDKKRSLLHQLWDELLEPDDPKTQASQLKLTNYLVPPNLWNISANDVALVTHGSASKFDNLDMQLRWWNGTTSVAVQLKTHADIDRLMDFYEESTLQSQMTIHVLLEKTQDGYPHNILRNLALENAPCDFFVALDGDFITNPNGHDVIYQQLQEDPELVGRLKFRELFLLPAFEILPQTNETTGAVIWPDETSLPRTQEELRARCLKDEILRFHRNSAPKSHLPANYRVWLFPTNETKAARYFAADPHDSTFEPYVLGYRKIVPRYTESFRGFGMNKVSWFQDLDMAGFQYNVLLSSWVSHINHPVSREKIGVDGERNKPHFAAFRTYLGQRYATSKYEPLPRVFGKGRNF